MPRVNTTKAVNAWIAGKHWKEKKTNSIWTSGGILYSYNTPIGKWSDADGKTAILDISSYSVTTSCQQNGVRYLLLSKGYTFFPCTSPEMFRDTDRK